MNCRCCGTALPAGATECPTCGTGVTAENAAEKTLPADAAGCPACGTGVTAENAAGKAEQNGARECVFCGSPEVAHGFCLDCVENQFCSGCGEDFTEPCIVCPHCGKKTDFLNTLAVFSLRRTLKKTSPIARLGADSRVIPWCWALLSIPALFFLAAEFASPTGSVPTLGLLVFLSAGLLLLLHRWMVRGTLLSQIRCRLLEDKDFFRSEHQKWRQESAYQKWRRESEAGRKA